MRPEPLDLSEARAAMPRRTAPRADSGAPFQGGSRSRIYSDWVVPVLSRDQEVRLSLRNMRTRSRELANNNDYVVHFLDEARRNVIGPNGIGLQLQLDEKKIPQAPALNRAIEDAWKRWCENVSVDGRMNFWDFSNLWLTSKLQDGEAFVQKVQGYPYNDCRFALDFLDPDVVDVNWNRQRRPGNEGDAENEIRMGIELDQWRRPVAYWIYQGHPSEFAGVKRIRIPADQVDHSLAFLRINQARGVPFIHSAMTRLHMLGAYEEAELVAARLGAQKVGYFVSEAPEDYQPGQRGTGANGKKEGAIRQATEPGEFESLPPNVKPYPVDWNHPNVAFPEFLRALLRGSAVGMGVGYSTASGDLREVNFSSLRQGILDEREGWRNLQTFTRDKLCRTVFAAWLPMALTTGELALPSKLPLRMVLDACVWRSRGWQWVDPLRDVQASVVGMRSGQETLADACADLGRDWRDVIDQMAIIQAYAKEKGVSLDWTTSGSGGIEGDTGAEDPARAAEPTKPAPQLPAKKPVKPNGHAAAEELAVRGVAQ